MSDAAAISRAFRQAFGLTPDTEVQLAPTLITIALRAEAADVLNAVAQHKAVPPEEIAEAILASRLKSLDRRHRRKGYR
jgi:hypothetical protein